MLTIPAPGAIAQQPAVPGAAVRRLIALSDERDLWERRLLAAERAAYLRGYADGQADEQRRDSLAWAARPLPRVPDPAAPTLAKLLLRRWGPGGREHFADPRPGDYRGGPVAPW